MKNIQKGNEPYPRTTINNIKAMICMYKLKKSQLKFHSHSVEIESQ